LNKFCQDIFHEYFLMSEPFKMLRIETIILDNWQNRYNLNQPTPGNKKTGVANVIRSRLMNMA